MNGVATIKHQPPEYQPVSSMDSEACIGFISHLAACITTHDLILFLWRETLDMESHIVADLLSRCSKGWVRNHLSTIRILTHIETNNSIVHVELACVDLVWTVLSTIVMSPNDCRLNPLRPHWARQQAGAWAIWGARIWDFSPWPNTSIDRLLPNVSSYTNVYYLNLPVNDRIPLQSFCLYSYPSTCCCCSSLIPQFDSSLCFVLIPAVRHVVVFTYHHHQPPPSTTTITTSLFIIMWNTKNIPPQHRRPRRPQPGAGPVPPPVAHIILGLLLLVIGVILGHYLTISLMVETVSVIPLILPENIMLIGSH